MVWYNEHRRHQLAGKGIKTHRKAYQSTGDMNKAFGKAKANKCNVDDRDVNVTINNSNIEENKIVDYISWKEEQGLPDTSETYKKYLREVPNKKIESKEPTIKSWDTSTSHIEEKKSAYVFDLNPPTEEDAKRDVFHPEYETPQEREEMDTKNKEYDNEFKNI